MRWLGTLIERYDNKKPLVHNHVKSLFNIEVVSKESAIDLRKMLDTISKNLRALKKFEQPTDNWDTLVIYVVAPKLDPSTIREWEKFKVDKEIPSLDKFKAFLKSRADLLETLQLTQGKSQSQSRDYARYTRGLWSTENAQVPYPCRVCKVNHYIQNCPQLLQLSINERIEKLKNLKLCLNCLRSGHSSNICRAGTCKKYNRKHHTLIHYKRSHKTKTNTEQSPSAENSVVLSSHISDTHVLLATVLVQIPNEKGGFRTVKALLDSGSQSCYIATGLCDELKLRTKERSIRVLGLNNCESIINRECLVNIQSMHSNFSIDISCFVVPQITGQLPGVEQDILNLKIPKHIKLADPSFFKPSRIEMLLGAQIFWQLMCIGQIDLGPNKPLLQKTRYGWIVFGSLGIAASIVTCNFSQINIQNQLSKCWELEDVPSINRLSKEESDCETHYIENTVREQSGRFVVALPLKRTIECLGDSYEQAKNRFISLEQKLSNKPDIKAQYVDFVYKYESLGHMTKLNKINPSEISYYMPHHCVIKENSITTKLRVVFDAPAPSSNGYSLNQLQMIGPTLQNTLFSIILRFQQHQYVVAADVAKMYRQIKFKPEHTRLQRILWRDDPNKELETFVLITLAYGTAAASYLAIRSLFELASECKQQRPKIAKITENDFYVDDLLTGANSVEEAAKIAREVRDILRLGCFELRKFYSNNPDVLKYVKYQDSNEASANILEFGQGEEAKILGLAWRRSDDKLSYNIGNCGSCKRINKRIILSSISQVFDPLGLLSPVIINIKILLQQLWLEKLTWDEGLPLQISEFWCKFRHDLVSLNDLSIDRYVLSKDYTHVEIHGFCDASEKAYGGVVYLRTVDKQTSV